MNPEQLAKLTASGLDMLSTMGGQAEITPEDIAAALHRLSDSEYEVLAVKYTGSHPGKLVRMVEARIQKVPPGNREQIASQAIAEALGHNRCPKCKGTREYTEHGKVGLCPLCEGAGVWFASAGMFQRYVDKMVSWLQRLESAGLSKIEPVDND